MREFRAERVPRPLLDLDVAALARRGPLDLEIGAGQGLHAIRYTQAHPDRILLAIERTHTKFERLLKRKERHPSLHGLIPLHADAVSVVSHYIPEQMLERVFLLYPNPYPKPKQANLRWYNSPFLSELKRKMKSGATLNLATNLEWYAREAEEALTSNWGFRLLSKSLLDTSAAPRTHFEKKYLARGESCHDLVFILEI